MRGFTLIEMSIVLVIIGLLVGGVLVGKDMINAAGVRAQITQIEKYNQAVNTFRGKYGALPGDMDAATAAQFGFAARGNFPGSGDGNGAIEGNFAPPGAIGCCNDGEVAGVGELAMVWVDLSQAGLIEGGFNTATPTSYPSSNIAGTGISSYFPAAKIGGGNYVYVWSGAVQGGSTVPDGNNYFGLSAVYLIATNGFITHVSPIWGTSSPESSRSRV